MQDKWGFLAAPAMLAVIGRCHSSRARVAARVPPAEDLDRLTRPSDHGKPMLRSSFSFSSPLRKRATYPGSCARVRSSSVARGAWVVHVECLCRFAGGFEEGFMGSACVPLGSPAGLRCLIGVLVL